MRWIMIGFKSPPGPGMTLEQYIAAYQRLANAPPREVLVRQYEARQNARSTLPDQAILRQEFREVTSIEQLAALTTLEQTARWLETTDPRTRARLDALGRCDPLATRRMVALATVDLRPIGVVPVNDSMAWGVVMPLGFHTQPRVINRASQTLVLRRVESGEWKVDVQAEGRAGSISYGNQCPRVDR